MDLLRAFEKEILAKVPHLEGGKVVNPTPLVELTQAMKDCARDEYGIDLSSRNLVVFGKVEAKLMGGSVNFRRKTKSRSMAVVARSGASARRSARNSTR